jgi:GT2 family glycosyltransferase
VRDLNFRLRPVSHLRLPSDPEDEARVRVGMADARATIVISTRDRREELRRAIISAVSQSVPVEVLIVDDSSNDGTAEMVRTTFPSVRLDRSEESLGYIAQRNRAARLSAAEVIFSIDDDAAFDSPYTVEQTLKEFDHPRVAAVAIPYVEPNKSPAVRQQAPSRTGVFVTDAFIGTAHALRRDIFLQLGGYRELLLHQGEEADLCIRMLDVGYVVRLGTADPIHHFESPRRDFSRMDFYGRRNDVLFAWHNVPANRLLGHLVGTTFNAARTAIACGRFWQMMNGTASGYADIFRLWRQRRPVSTSVYRIHRMLKKRGPQLLDNVEPLLPNIQTNVRL